MKKILIQANNLDMVIDVFMYIYLHSDCSKKDLADYCGFSLRQVDYYTNACKYLDLINQDWSITELGKDIFENSPTEIKERIYQRIAEDSLMGPIYQKMAAEPTSDHHEFARHLVEENYPGLSDAVYNRRSDNIIKWCKKIISYTQNN